jgi:hypothetical protein
MTNTVAPSTTRESRIRHGLVFCVVAMIAAGSGCSGQSPLSPEDDLATVSGHIYLRDPVGAQPLVANALIWVQEADGSQRTALSNADGYYTVSVRPGSVSITASKEGYEAKVWHFMLLNDTVLNFSLTPT